MNWTSIGVIFLSSWAWSYQSNHIKGFQLSQCDFNTCAVVKSPLAFVSQSQDMMLARNVMLEIKKSESVESHPCAVFRYSVRSQQMDCDNEDVAGAKSFSVNSKLDIISLN